MSRAVVVTGYGPPDVLRWQEVETAEPGSGQVRLRVRAAGVGPTDLAIRRGVLRAVFPLPEPAILGFEVAGVVDAVGPDVTAATVGDEVVALLPQLGGYAEHALASVWKAKPATLTWSQAAALPASGEAAVGVLRQVRAQAGETLLVLGAGGSVGLIAVQLAVAQGLQVLAAARRHDHALLSELGAIPVDIEAGVDGAVRGLTSGLDAIVAMSGGGAAVVQSALGLLAEPGQPQRPVAQRVQLRGDLAYLRARRVA